jgi:hypothetical protein
VWEVKRAAVARALRVNGAPYIDFAGRAEEDLFAEYGRAGRKKPNRWQLLKYPQSKTGEDWRRWAEVNCRLGQQALLLGKDSGYANFLDYAGVGYYNATCLALEAEGLDAALPLFLQAREVLLRAARVYYLLAEEVRYKELSFAQWMGNALLMVGKGEILCGNFEAGMAVQLLALFDLMERHTASNDSAYLKIMVGRLTSIAKAYWREGRYLESARAGKTQAEILVVLGDRVKARQVYWDVARKLRRQLMNDGDAASWKMVCHCLSRVMGLVREENNRTAIGDVERHLAYAQRRLAEIRGEGVW